MKKNVLALSIAAMIGGLGFVGSASAQVVGTDTTTTPATKVSVDTVKAGQMLRSTIGAPNTVASNIRAAGPAATGGVNPFQLADGGVGHVLIVPYYTAQAGNNTVLHVVNTDNNNGKVAKVRFRAAANSDDVLDFQILLSPGDVWTAFVGRGADGVATLTTYDNTCSIPAIKQGVAVPFVQERLDPKLSADDKANNTREGYVEIFNSADIPGGKFYGALNNDNSALYKATKHVAGKAPCDTAVIQAALFNENFVNGNVAKAVGMGLDSPTGGLTGDWYIINVPNTTTYSGGATALVGNSPKGVPAIGNFLAFPQNDAITFAPRGQTELYTADPTLVSPGQAFVSKDDVGGGKRSGTADAAGNAAFADNAVIEAIALDFPDLSTPYTYVYGATLSALAPLNQAASLTQALAVNSIINQYATDASISAKTDWVFSMPTRRYSVALDYNKRDAKGEPTRVYSSVAAPYNGRNIEFFHDRNTQVVNGQICINTEKAEFFDREEGSKAGNPEFSPSKAKSARLCGEANVVSFGQGGTSSAVLGGSVAREDVAAAAIFENGWGRLTTTNGGVGLPILGFSVQKLYNAAASAGMSGTYGITWAHRYDKTNK